jgi:nucleoid-associated protein YgaU
MDRLEQLKTKYAPALRKIEELGVSLRNLHVQDNKLFLKGAAPTEAAKNEVWSTIKQVDAAYADLTADLTVDPSLPAPKPRSETYTVKAGDTLSKISKQFYGNPNKYMAIFEANRDQLSDPDKIQVGQTLKIPSA